MRKAYHTTLRFVKITLTRTYLYNATRKRNADLCYPDHTEIRVSQGEHTYSQQPFDRPLPLYHDSSEYCKKSASVVL